MLRAILTLLILTCLTFSKEKIFYLMGTYVVVDIPEEEEAYRAYRIMRSLEEKLSDYIPTSEISLINALAGDRPVAVSGETLEVIRKSLEVSEKTYGYFDASVGAITIRHLREKSLSLEEAKGLVNYKDIEVEGSKVFLRRRGMALDLGGIGKGFILEKTYEALKVPKGFIGAAGDMKVWGEKRLLGVKDPISGGVLLQMVNSGDLCLSTSGNYLRRHIDQKDEDLLQITVVYRDCTYADAYATALFSMPKELRRKFERENPEVGVLELFKDGSLYMNGSFRGYFEILVLKRENKSQN